MQKIEQIKQGKSVKKWSEIVLVLNCWLKYLIIHKEISFFLTVCHFITD